MPLLLGIIALVVLWWMANGILKANPKQAARLARRAGGVAALAFAVFLFFRGEFAVAIPVGLFGLGLLGWASSFWPPNFAQRRPEPVSRVRSPFLEMELDPAGAPLRGRILTGPYQGVSLDALDLPTLTALAREVDDGSRRLLIGYLDRREPGWREYAQRDATAGGRSGASSAKMTEEEAYQVLGLQSGASADEIGRAHRSLMKKLHPDQGGSTYLAARVNQAKDVLLRRHR
jgi:hypothetical protein